MAIHEYSLNFTDRQAHMTNLLEFKKSGEFSEELRNKSYLNVE